MTSFIVGVLVGLVCMLVGWTMAREDQKLNEREAEKNNTYKTIHHDDGFVEFRG